MFGIAPGKIGVALGKARLCKGKHHLGPREGLGKKQGVGEAVLDLFNEVLPKGEGLGVGVVHPEDPDAALGPEGNHVGELAPEFAPLGVVEIEGVDVLVFFGGILGVLDGAVGPGKKPVGMFADVGMVWGTVDGEVEGDLHSAGADFPDQPVKVLQGAEFGGDVAVASAVWTALMAVADGVGDPGFARLTGDGVVAPLACAQADWMDWGKVDDVEAHGLGGVDALETVAEGGATVCAALGGTREEFIPGSKEGLAPVHGHPGVAGHGAGKGGGVDQSEGGGGFEPEFGGLAKVGVGGHEGLEFGGVREGVDPGVGAGAQLGGEGGEPVGVVGVAEEGGPGRGLF